MLPEAITIDNIRHCSAVARGLCRNNPFLAEDIASELCVRVLESDIAEWEQITPKLWSWAIDYMRSKKVNYSYGNAFWYISLEALWDAGVQIDTDLNVLIPKALRRAFRQLEQWQNDK